MKYELTILFIDRETNKEYSKLGTIKRDTKEELLDIILNTQSIMESKFFYPKYILKENK